MLNLIIWIITHVQSQNLSLDGFRRFDVKHAFFDGVTSFSVTFLISGIDAFKIPGRVPSQFLNSVLKYETYVLSTNANPSAIDPSSF